MDPIIDLTILEPHASRLCQMLADGPSETAACMLFGVSDIGADPWIGLPRMRLVSYQFQDIEPLAIVSTSVVHVTWGTADYMRLLSGARATGLGPVIVHTHSGSSAFFSEQDDANEAKLARTVTVKGVRGLGSIVLGGTARSRLDCGAARMTLLTPRTCRSWVVASAGG